MELPRLDGVTHRTVVARGLRFHVAEAGAGDPDRARARLAAALVDVAPRRAPARAARASGDDRPARLRLVRRAARRPTTSRRWPTTCSPCSTRSGSIGCAWSAHDWGAWSGFLACLAAPERFAAFLALGCPRPGGRPSARQLREVWRFGYQVAIAAPLLGRRLVADQRFVERVIMAGAVQPPGVDARRPARVHGGAGRAGARAGQRAPLPDVPRARGRPHARADACACRRGSCSATATRPSPPCCSTAPRTTPTTCRVEIVPDCGHFVPEEHPDARGRARPRAASGLH